MIEPSSAGFYKAAAKIFTLFIGGGRLAAVIVILAKVCEIP